MMDVVNEEGVWRVVLMTSSAVGKTSAIDNIEGYFIAQDPCPMLGVLPTLDEAEGYSKERLTPYVQATPALMALVGETRSRDSGATLRFKKFPGGYLALAGSNSAASLQRRHVRVVWGDEIDSYETSIDNEGDPVSLMVQRTARFESNRLVILAGTPTVRGASRLEQVFIESDRRHFFMPCARCRERFVLIWQHTPKIPWPDPSPKVASVAWRDNNPENAHITCGTCHGEFGDAERLAMVAAGDWQATARFDGTAGLHIWEGCAISKLSDLVREWLEKKKHKATLQTFINKRLGELWEPEGAGEEFGWQILKKRSSDDPDVNPDDHLTAYKLGDVPPGVLMIFAGVDTQDNRYAPVVYGFGRGEEAWLLYWGEIFGDPVYDETSQQLDSLLAKKFRQGATDLPILGMAVDSGGHRAQAVYNFARSRAPKVIATKGMSRPGLPIIAGKPTAQDVAWGGKLIRGGVQLWPVGADTAKAEIYARLRLASGPRSIHFPSDLPDEFYEQLVSEVLITKLNKGVPYREWFLPAGKRNEALDATALAFAAAIRGGIQRVNWEQLEATMSPSSVTQMEPQRIRSRYVHG